MLMRALLVRARRCGASVVATLLLASLAACGGGGGGGGGGGSSSPAPIDPGVAGAPYFTFAVGDRWRSRDGSVTYTTRVTRQEAGTLFLQQVGDDGSIEDIVFERTDAGVTAVPPASADALTAAIGRYDIARFPLRAGASYTAVERAVSGVDLDGDNRADNLQVRVQVTVVGFERITVPAGTFDNALRQRTVVTQTAVLSASARSVTITGTSEDWYAPGVGPVRTLLVIEGDGGRETSEELLLDYRVGTASNDNVAPTVASRTPAPDSLGANASVQIVFSEGIERASLPADAITVRSAAGQPVPGRSQWLDARTLAFLPDGFGAFASGRYTATLNGSPEDWAGNRLAGTVQWSFDIDRSGPVLVSRMPADQASDVAPDATFSFTFDEVLSPAVATSGQVSLSGRNGPLPITLRVDGRVLTVTPAAPLERGQFYSILVARVQDVLGNQGGFGVSTAFTVDPGRFALPRMLAAFEGRRVPGSTLADVNGDGRADLLAFDQPLVGGFDSATRLLLRAADGTLPATGVLLPGLLCNGSLQVLDVDADGRADVLSTAPSCGLQWVGQNADGSFALRSTLASNVAESQPVGIAGSTRQALAFIDESRNIRLLRPSGANGFAAAQTLHAGAGTASAGTLRVADVNGDGRLDLLAQLVIGGNNQLWIARQRADGEFDTELVPTPGRTLLFAADLSGDGRVDLLLQPAFPSAEVVLLRQAADGSFPAQGEVFTLPGRAASKVALGDLDGDGRPDLTLPVLDSRGSVVNFVLMARRNDGSFLLTRLLDYDAANMLSLGDLHVADFSADGRNDLLFAGALIRGRGAIAAPNAAGAGTPMQRMGQAAQAAARALRQ